MPNLIEIICPQCKSAFAVPEQQLGARITCPDCLEEFEIDASTATRMLLPGVPAQPSADNSDLADIAGATAEDVFGTHLEPVGASPTGDASTPARPVLEGPYDFTTSCPLCGTRQDVTSLQIGRKLKCPDCHSNFKVQEPHRTARRPRAASHESHDGEFQLSEPVASSLRTKISDEWMGVAKEDLARDAATRAKAPSPADVVHEALRNATQEYAQQVEAEAELPKYPFRAGILRTLSNPGTLGRWIVTGIALEIELSAIEMTIRSARGGGFEQVFALLFGIFATVFGFLLFCFVSTSLLLVTQHTSQGRDDITGWPSFNVIEWAFEAWPMMVTLFLTFAPGVLLGQMVGAISRDTTSISWLGVGIGVISMTLLFPILLLSQMENGAPYSKPIWRSVRLCQPVWLSFWLHSGSLVLVLGWLVSLRFKWGSGLEGLLLSTAMVLGLFVYFRFLGRLSWACDEALVRLDEASQSANRDDG